MKHYRRIFALLVVLACILSCAAPAFAGEEQAADYDAMVNDAIEVLAEKWNSKYWDPSYPDKEYLLDIRSTRIIVIKDELGEKQAEYFGDIDYIIEFLLYDDYLSFGEIQSGQNIGYYSYTGMNDSVIVHSDGTMTCTDRYLAAYRNRTFDADFSTFIETVIDLHEEYNQIIRFHKQKIIFES